MSEYLGDTESISLQQAIRARAGELAANPLLANAGRWINVLDPNAYGWDNVRRDVERDGFLALTVVDKESALSRLAEEFGQDIAFPCWNSFIGQPDQVLPVCKDVTAGTELPAGWTVSNHTHPQNDVIQASQELNQANGVAAPPAYYLRGEVVPSMLTCVWDRQGAMAACASSNMRFHAESPLAGWLFAGGVSVKPEHRRMGLGSFVNASLLQASHDAFGWIMAVEAAKPGNAASVGMIKRCGLCLDANRVSIGVNPGGGFATR
jgi:hypothetical protein